MYQVFRGDIQDSPYVLEPEGFVDVKLYFTSPKAMERFEERLAGEIEKGNEKLNNIFKGMFNIDCSLLSAIRLYVREERRGFLVQIEDKQYEKPHHIDFFIDGE